MSPVFAFGLTFAAGIDSFGQEDSEQVDAAFETQPFLDSLDRRADDIVLHSHWGFAVSPWPNGVVPYFIQTGSLPSTVNKDAWVASIRAGIAIWNRDSRLIFIERTTQSNYVQLKYWGANYSRSDGLGYKPGTGPHVIQLSGSGDATNGGVTARTVAHELGHRVGLKHEHQRPDRSDHVWYFPDSVTDDCEVLIFGCENENFNKCLNCEMFGEYDHESIMHYPSFNFSNGQPTLLRKDTWTVATGGNPNYTTCRTTGLIHSPLETMGTSRVGDFDGDGSDDLLFHDGSRFRVSYSNVNTTNSDCSAPVTLGGAVVAGITIDDVAIGNFDNDNRADIFIADGTSWRVMRSGSQWAPESLAASTDQMSKLDLGFFNSDNVSDVIKITGLDIKVSFSATGVWSVLQGDFNSAEFYGSVLVGDFTKNGNDDIVAWGQPTLVPPFLPYRMVVSENGTGVWQELISGWPLNVTDWIRTRMLTRLSGPTLHDSLIYADHIGGFQEFNAATSEWQSLPGNLTLAKVPGNQDYFRTGDFNGDGEEFDIITNGIILQNEFKSVISTGDTKIIEYYYGECPDTLKQKYTGCYGPVPIAATVAAIL